jgi:signal transduction histidine kinase
MSRSDPRHSSEASGVLANDEYTRSKGKGFEIDFLTREVSRLEAMLSDIVGHSLHQRDAEREAIARELHDKLGQYLTVVDMELKAIECHPDTTPDLRRRARDLGVLTSEAHREIRILAWKIRPTSLGDGSLEEAVEGLLEDWSERSALTFDVHFDLSGRRLSPSIETTLFCVLQEAIVNVARHAKASRVGVIFRATATGVQLIVEDDGSGISTTSNDDRSGPHLGLLGIRERIAIVGGSFEIETTDGRGTTLLVTVPR